jgi:hypothetical protein
MGALDDPANPYLCASRYATQLERYLECFDRGRILVIDHRDLLEHRGRTLAEVFRFLDVDAAFESPEFERLHNTRSAKVRYSELGMWLIRRGVLTGRPRSSEGEPLIGPVRNLLSRPIDDALPSTLRERLIEDLQPEVERLRALTGKAFSQWPNFAVEEVRVRSGAPAVPR